MSRDITPTYRSEMARQNGVCCSWSPTQETVGFDAKWSLVRRVEVLPGPLVVRKGCVISLGVGSVGAGGSGAGVSLRQPVGDDDFLALALVAQVERHLGVGPDVANPG